MSSIYTPNPSAGVASAYTKPDDGDARNAASVDVMLESLADGLARVNQLVIPNGYGVVSAGNFASAASAHTWLANFSASENVGLCTILGVVAGDLVIVHAGTSFEVATPTDKARVRIAHCEQATSYTDAFSGVWIDPGLSERWMANWGDDGSHSPRYFATELSTMIAITYATGHVRFAFQADGGGGQVALQGTTPIGGYYQVLRQLV